MSSFVRPTAFAAALLAATSLGAQQQSGSASADPTTRTRVPESAYSRWETLGQSALSPDGKWVAYDFRRATGPGELRYRQVGANDEHTVARGSGATFSANSRWLLYTILPDSGGGRGGRGGGAAGGRGGGRGGGGAAAGDAPPVSNRNAAAIVDLRTGTTTVLDDIQSFSINKTGTAVALRRYAPPGRTSRGADIVVRDLDAGTSLLIGNTAEYAWSDDGKSLAMVMDVEGKTGNGVQLLDAATFTQKSLDNADAIYSNLQWREKSNDIAVLRSRADSGFIDTSYAVVVIRDAAMKPAKQVYDFSADAKFPRDLRVASYRAVQWSEDGGMVFFGVAPREPKPTPAPRGGAQPARVEVWHWKDLREYHTQAVSGAQDRTRTLLASWQPGQSSSVVLSHDIEENIQLSANRKAALVGDENPYFTDVISGRTYRDFYQVDLATGARKKLLTKNAANAAMSPSGKSILYSQGGAWWTMDLATGGKTNLTGTIKSVFVDMEDDHPVAERRPYGQAGWSTAEKVVLLYDRFDVWQVNTDGSAPTRLTKGKEDSTVYRIVRIEDDAAPGGRGGGGGRGGAGGGAQLTDLTRPITFSMTGDYTRKSGYARLTPGQPIEKLLFVDKGVSRLAKAKEADVSMYVQQTYEESPNLFVATGPLAGAKQVSNTNAFQSEYLWGKQVLLPYTSKRGDKLEMMLTYPAGYVPGKKYPMVVYYYEKLSDTFHNYVIPTDRSTYNTTVFSQEGYFVLRPDILFKSRDPGYSGLDCVTAAVKAALATGMIDPAKVGNFGHSWGGYQSAFYAVHGKGVFAASIAGAPLTDLVSMYGYSSGNTGAPETGHFETGQERMDVPLWKDPAAYIRNSSVFATDSLDIPLLIEIGDADGNVNPSQGQELYNFGRRLGKNVVMLVYNDENHSVARPESQLDYHKRQIEWFAHYLKGEPAADWITNGETYLTRQKLLKDAGTPPAAAPGGGRGRGGSLPR